MKHGKFGPKDRYFSIQLGGWVNVECGMWSALGGLYLVLVVRWMDGRTDGRTYMASDLPRTFFFCPLLFSFVCTEYLEVVPPDLFLKKCMYGVPR